MDTIKAFIIDLLEYKKTIVNNYGEIVNKGYNIKQLFFMTLQQDIESLSTMESLFKKHFAIKYKYRTMMTLISCIMPWNENWMDNLKNENVITIATENEKESKRKDIQIEIVAINVFGCKKSRDIDVMVVVKDYSQIMINDYIKDYVKQKLASIGYDVSRPIDINVCCKEHGNLQMMLHGGKETQNIIYHTYKFHKQIDPCIVDKTIEIIKFDKIIATAKFILDNFDKFVDDKVYKVENRNRKIAYCGHWTKISYVIDLMQNNLMLKYSDSIDWLNRMKSLTMKIVQIILAEQDIYLYSKDELIDKMCELFGNELYNGLSYLLFYGTEGYYDQKVVDYLFNQFCSIAINYEPSEPEWQEIPVNFNGSIPVNDIIVQEFFNSPMEQTQKLKDFMKGKSVNEMFIIPCVGKEHLKSIEQYCIFVDQRTRDWLEFNKKYSHSLSCVPQWIGYYHMIRANIMEMFCIFHSDFSQLFPNAKSIERATVGYLIKDDIGIAPDMILNVDGVLYPVEIKCLIGNNHNSDHRRAIELAKKELKTCSDIIGENGINKGILLFMHIFELNDEDDSTEFEACAVIIDL